MARLSIKDLTEQVNVAIPYLDEHNDRLKFPKEKLEELKELRVEWNAIVETTSSPLTRTPASVEEMHDQKIVLEKAFSNMQQSLKHSVDVVLTGEDRKALFIPKSKTRSVIPVPKITPIINIISRGIRTLTIQLSNSESPDLNHTKLPKDVHSINIFTAIVKDGDPEPTLENYHLFKNESKSNIELVFERGDEKKIVYIYAAFLNSKGQSGPLSDSVNSVISN